MNRISEVVIIGVLAGLLVLLFFAEIRQRTSSAGSVTAPKVERKGDF